MGGWTWDFITNFRGGSPVSVLEAPTYANSTSSIMAGYGSPSAAVTSARYTSYRIT